MALSFLYSLYSILSNGPIMIGASSTISGGTLTNVSFVITSSGSLTLIGNTLTNLMVSNSQSATGSLIINGTSVINAHNFTGNSSSSPLSVVIAGSHSGTFTGYWIDIVAFGQYFVTFPSGFYMENSFLTWNGITYNSEATNVTFNGTDPTSYAAATNNAVLTNCTFMNWAYVNIDSTTVLLGPSSMFQGIFKGSSGIVGGSIGPSYSVQGLPPSSWPALTGGSGIGGSMSFSGTALSYIDWNATTISTTVAYGSLQGPASQISMLTNVLINCKNVTASTPCVTMPVNVNPTLSSNNWINWNGICQVGFSGIVNFNRPFSVDTVCSTSTATINMPGPGYGLEITTAITANSAEIDFVGQGSTVNLESIAVQTSHPVSVSGFSSFTYNISNPSIGIVSSSTNLTINNGPTLQVEWGASTTLAPGVTYPFLTTNSGALSTVSFVNATCPGCNVTLSHSGSTYNLVFAAQPCNSNCVAANMASTTCVSSESCSCIPPWGGPWCDCDTSKLPAGGFTCGSSVNGPVWIAPSGVYPKSITVPPGYTLDVSAGILMEGFEML